MELICSEEVVEFIVILAEKDVGHLDVELTARISATPILLHNLLREFVDIDDLIVGLFLIEFITFPNENLMLVELVTRKVVLRLDTQNQHGILLQVFEIKDCCGLVPVWISIELGFVFLLLINNVSVIFHLLTDWVCFDEVFRKIDEKLAPFVDISVQLIVSRLLLLEEKRPKLLVFTTLFKSNDFFVGLLIFLEQFDISSGLVHVLTQINIWDISSLPDVNWHVGMSLDNEDTTRIQLFALVTLIQVLHQEPTGDLVRVFRLVTTNQEHARENWNAVH